MAEEIHATKVAILNATERLVAAHGFGATSLRAITATAGVNLAAVNYHFATKDALILAMLNRRMKPLNEARLALLDRFEAEAGDGPVPVEKILEALFRPVLELIARPSKGGRSFLRLLALCLGGTGCLSSNRSCKRNSPRKSVASIAPCGGACRSSPRCEMHWRLHFAHGAFFHAVAHSQVLELCSGGLCRLTDIEAVLDRVIKFGAAGLRNAA